MLHAKIYGWIYANPFAMMMNEKYMYFMSLLNNLMVVKLNYGDKSQNGGDRWGGRVYSLQK